MLYCISKLISLSIKHYNIKQIFLYLSIHYETGFDSCLCARTINSIHPTFNIKCPKINFNKKYNILDIPGIVILVRTHIEIDT